MNKGMIVFSIILLVVFTSYASYSLGSRNQNEKMHYYSDNSLGSSYELLKYNGTNVEILDTANSVSISWDNNKSFVSIFCSKKYGDCMWSITNKTCDNNCTTFYDTLDTNEVKE